MNHRELWKEVFGDTDKYIEYYFKEKAKKSKIYSIYESDELVSMAFFTPYEMVCRGELCSCPYIVGVATRKESRGRGHMRTNIEQGLDEFREAGARLAFLSPVDEKIYRPLGFLPVYYHERIEVYGHKKKWYEVVSLSQMGKEKMKEMEKFTCDLLTASDLDLYMYHSTKYLSQLHKEMKALEGEVVALWEGERICGVAAYTREEDVYEVTELICDPKDGRKVMESLCAYLDEEETKKVTILDGYFLGEVSGEGIQIMQSKKPYIMVKLLNMKEEETGLRVYINDIT
ncbi:MAG: GNAT family N-acetyltransferase [Eubacterium sp.]|nr:GNAT family N-acetyltransferase [Eubacterium sp.]